MHVYMWIDVYKYAYMSIHIYVYTYLTFDKQYYIQKIIEVCSDVFCKYFQFMWYKCTHMYIVSEWLYITGFVYIIEAVNNIWGGMVTENFLMCDDVNDVR
jgi:hypothetical protein